MHFFLLVCAFSAAFAQECSKDKKSTHSRLNEELLCGYERTIRPKLARENATTVSIRMVLKSLNYEMHSGVLVVNSWLVLSWQDDHLVWKPSDYEDITLTHLSNSNIWVPDLSIYNKADQVGNPSAMTEVDCLVHNNGHVICVTPTNNDAICVPDLTQFPFDTQNCTLRYGSWVHSGEEIDFKLSKPPVTIEDYTENGEWKLVSVNATKNSGLFKCCPDNTYPTLKYNFILDRHSGSQMCMAIGPALVIIMVTFASLCMNFQEMERILVITCNLVLHLLYLQYISWQLPIHGPKSPLILIYSRDSFVLSAFSLILTVFERKFSKYTSASPTWISSFASGIINSRPGQFIFLFDDRFKKLANKSGDEDGVNIIENTEQPTTDWSLFAQIIDRLCLIIYTIIYFCMFIAFVP